MLTEPHQKNIYPLHIPDIDCHEMKNLLMESEDRFKNMADAAPVLLWLTKEDGACIYFNQSWLDFTGRTLEQEKGFGWFHGIHPEDLERCIHQIISNYSQKKSFQTEYRLRDRNGEYRWMMSRGMPRYNVDAEYAGFTGSCVDITDHKILVDELKAAKEAADNASLIKTQFLANVSHEIRTPLGIILGFADILRNEEISKVERLDLLDRILKSGNQLLHIIDDVLDVSKVEANRFELEIIDFSLKDFIKEISDLFDFRAQEKGLVFKTLMSSDLPDYVKSDPTRMRQVLTNIIGNAIKFTQSGKVELKISTFVQADKLCLGFTISDTGIGIGPDSSHRLFKPFCQLDASTTRKYGGTGLGLHLSRKLALMLGGDLKLISSKKFKGSTFFFQLPVETSLEKDRNTCLTISDELQENFSNLKGKSILVVDDAEENRILLEKYLSPFETNLQFAQNGAEAVEMTHQKKFDLVLMDIQMPVLDGFGALEKIRTFDTQTPVIALTAHALKTERDRCLNLGFYEHMAKPINRQKLVSTLSNLISQCSQKKSLILSNS